MSCDYDLITNHSASSLKSFLSTSCRWFFSAKVSDVSSLLLLRASVLISGYCCATTKLSSFQCGHYHLTTFVWGDSCCVVILLTVLPCFMQFFLGAILWLLWSSQSSLFIRWIVSILFLSFSHSASLKLLLSYLIPLIDSIVSSSFCSLIFHSHDESCQFSVWDSSLAFDCLLAFLLRTSPSKILLFLHYFHLCVYLLV